MTKRQAKIKALHALADIADSRSNQPKEYPFKESDAYREVEKEIRLRAINLQKTEDRAIAKKAKK